MPASVLQGLQSLSVCLEAALQATCPFIVTQCTCARCASACRVHSEPLASSSSPSPPAGPALAVRPPAKHVASDSPLHSHPVCLQGLRSLCVRLQTALQAACHSKYNPVCLQGLRSLVSVRLQSALQAACLSNHNRACLQGLRSLCVRLQSALQDAASQRAVAQLSRSSSRRLTRGDSGRGAAAAAAPGQERRSLGSRSSSLRQSRRSYEVNLAAERGALPAGGA